MESPLRISVYSYMAGDPADYHFLKKGYRSSSIKKISYVMAVFYFIFERWEHRKGVRMDDYL